MVRNVGILYSSAVDDGMRVVVLLVLVTDGDFMVREDGRSEVKNNKQIIFYAIKCNQKKSELPSTQNEG